MRYALEVGGKRVRPVICLATAEAAGGDAETALPAAAALELVHTFSLVHDDLPALDDDEVRRGHPSTWSAFGEAVGILAGDALLAEAFRLALSYPTTAVGARARPGDARDDRRPVPRHHRSRRRPRLAAPAEDGLPLRRLGRARPLGGGGAGARAGAVARVRRRARAALPGRRRHPRRGRLRARARRRGGAASSPTRRPSGRAPRLAEIDADTSVLEGIVDELAVRTS